MFWRAAMRCALCSSKSQQEPRTLVQVLHLLASAANCEAEVHKHWRRGGGAGRRLTHAAVIGSLRCTVAVTCRYVLWSRTWLISALPSATVSSMNRVLRRMHPHLQVLNSYSLSCKWRAHHRGKDGRKGPSSCGYLMHITGVQWSVGILPERELHMFSWWPHDLCWVCNAQIQPHLIWSTLGLCSRSRLDSQKTRCTA